HNVKRSHLLQYIIEECVRPGGGDKKEKKKTTIILSNLTDDADVAPKKSDGEKKYEPLEADATETEVNVETATVLGNAANVQDTELPVEEVRAYTDDDFDMNSNSIVDADEKEHADHEKSDKSRRESRKRAYNQTRQLQDVSVPPRPKYEGDAPQEEQPSSDDENNTKTPPRDGISTIETVMKKQKERTAQYFKVPLRKETYKLDDMSRKCLSIQSQQDVPDKKENKKKEKLAKGEAAVRTAEYEDKDVRHDAKNDKEEDVGELEYITDITENMNERKGKIPSYTYCHQHQIGIGKSMMKQVQSFYCGCCRQLMLTEDVNAHLRSIIHYHNFVSEVESL
ncbi:hypothetical protein X777_12837, partial [Ooceraea biroi]